MKAKAVVRRNRLMNPEGLSVAKNNHYCMLIITRKLLRSLRLVILSCLFHNLNPNLLRYQFIHIWCIFIMF
jgi:hypothetical protein